MTRGAGEGGDKRGGRKETKGEGEREKGGGEKEKRRRKKGEQGPAVPPLLC